MNQRRQIKYELHQLVPYINWIYYYHAWQVKDAAEQQRLREEAECLLAGFEGRYHVHALFLLADANSDGDDLVVFDAGPVAGADRQPAGSVVRIPFLRQQHQQPGQPCLCLADFVRPLSQGIPDMVGFFATSVDAALVADHRRDDYLRMTTQLLADRLAEAAAEKMHQEVRRRYWGYQPDEQLTMAELHAEQFQGIRPAVGYPSLPDASLNFILSSLLRFSDIGIRLTESGAMVPHASVSGLMLAHPQSRYFAVGAIDEEQLHDYARRRGIPVELARRFLSSSLRTPVSPKSNP